MSVIELAGQRDSLDSVGLFGKIADAASEYFRLEGQAEAELVFCSKEEIRSVNSRMRGVDSATDVLSFPYLTLNAGRYKPFTAANFPYDIDPVTQKVSLGSIMICRDVAKAQAAEYGHTTEREEGYLFLHGLLHLLGFDHITDSDKTEMREAEEEILGGIGLARNEL